MTMRHTTNGKVAWGALMLGAALVLSACSSKASGSPAGSGAPNTIRTASVSSVGTVLIDAQGMTLYLNTREAGGHIVCTGGCASVWPPVLASSGKAPSAGSGVTGKLGTLTRPDGSVQVTYNGWPLYRYSGDKTPGQATGQGIQGIWFAMSPSGQPAKSSGQPAPAPSGSSSSPSGGYNY